MQSTLSLQPPSVLMNNHRQEVRDSLRLIRTPSLGIQTFYQAMALYGNASKAIEKIHALRSKRHRNFQLVDAAIVDKEIAQLDAIGAQCVLWTDEAYPPLLKHIPDAPPVLIVLGNLQLLTQPMIAMVGTRNASVNGSRLAKQWASELVGKGYIIASGLARGIDTAAHQGASAASTVAVLGGGIDYIYPRENTVLYHAIAQEGGVLMSEMPFGMVPKAENFPRRNRIVSGMSKGVVVIEAALRSGSLITARLASEYNREVMAVPGFPLDPRTEGANALIRDGAVLVRHTEDIVQAVQGVNTINFSSSFMLEEVGQQYHSESETIINDNEFEALSKKILRMLSLAPTPINEVIAMSQTESRQVLATLLELELCGEVMRHAGNHISLIAS